MKLCRYNDNRLGIVEGNEVIDVTPALDLIPPMRYPAPMGDQLIANLAAVRAKAGGLKAGGQRLPLDAVKFLPPVGNPTKIVNAPINYDDHIAESKADAGIAHGRTNITHISDWGLFLKANSALIGFGDEVKLRFPDRRNDHELELAVIIGKTCHKATQADALSYVAGYSMGLDMTIRGKQQTCWRKSVDTYAVCGPWMVTADELPDPTALDLVLKVNGEVRQNSNTKFLVYNIPRLIEYATEMYTLHPGDIIFSGTPAGVGPVVPGDVMSCYIQGIGEREMRVAKEYA
ncbi:MAG: 2-hydroxyhepta-2,4-diene,7-dioate isomerase [Betaproteobacteria bacterium]|nr:2-hydroxyhepta-2,4-diene,7-dioate isomerase [Betaproteobacteria bacterium]